jgi:hypothetical protein
MNQKWNWLCVFCMLIKTTDLFCLGFMSIVSWSRHCCLPYSIWDHRKGLTFYTAWSWPMILTYEGMVKDVWPHVKQQQFCVWMLLLYNPFAVQIHIMQLASKCRGLQQLEVISSSTWWWSGRTKIFTLQWIWRKFVRFRGIINWLIVSFLMLCWMMTVMKWWYYSRLCMGGHKQLQGTKRKFNR